jgi:Ca2+-binding RTX toxin-like protein
MGLGGADILTGGAGNDVFRYLAQSDSTTGAGADRITDFTIGEDRINFSKIDTNPGLAGDQGFAFAGTTAFAGGGLAQVRYLPSGSDLIVQADVNGDAVADMEVILQGLAGQVLGAGDFVL